MPDMVNPVLPPVRFATPDDYPQIISLSEALHEENGHGKIDYDVAEATIMQAINQHRSLIGIIGPVGDIQGIILLRFASFWFSADVFLEELFMYVPPEYRKSPNARALLAFAKNTADRLKLPLMIGVLSNDKTEAKIRFYERQFGQRAGGYFYLYPQGWGKYKTT